jgi:hypothetical protein
MRFVPLRDPCSRNPGRRHSLLDGSTRSRFHTDAEHIVIPSSVPIIVATAALTLLAAAVLGWAWWRGFFRDLDAQARVIFEPDDLQLERPWETPVQRIERETVFGAPVRPHPGEWGGAA